MDANTEIDLDVLQDAIKADIAVAFPALQTVEFYDEHRKGMPLPACLLELTEWQDFNEPDPGTEQQAVTARFEARFIIPGVQTQAGKRAIRKLAAAFTAYIRLRRWTDAAHVGKKLPTGPAQFVQAYTDDFDPDKDQFAVWCVEWTQVLHLGESVWNPDGTTAPDTVFSSFAPDIGEGNQDSYTQIVP